MWANRPEFDHDIPVLPVSYADLIQDVKPDAIIRIDDGQVTLWVETVDYDAGFIHCRVIRGDRIEPNKGLNIIGSSISAANLTPDMDIPQLESIISELPTELWPEFISLSFVKSVDDIHQFKRVFLELCHRYNKEITCAPGVIAKIERFELFDYIEDAIKLGDQTNTDLLTFLKRQAVETCLGDRFPYCLDSTQQSNFDYDQIYAEMEQRNLMPSSSRLSLLRMKPGRVIRGLYSLREILRL